jgi:Tfp pilus assembly protein PilF
MNWQRSALPILSSIILASPCLADYQAFSEAWQTTRRQLSEQATVAFGKSDWQEARQLYNKILEHEPRNPMILANLGAIEYQLGDYTASCYYLESALAKKADLMSSREMLGMAYHLNKKPLRAVATLATAVANQPESPRAHNQLAVVLQAMAWYDGAEKSLLKAIQLDPDYRDAHFNLALIYIDRKAPSSKLARKHYETAVELGATPDKELEERLKRSP